MVARKPRSWIDLILILTLSLASQLQAAFGQSIWDSLLAGGDNAQIYQRLDSFHQTHHHLASSETSRLYAELGKYANRLKQYAIAASHYRRAIEYCSAPLADSVEFQRLHYLLGRVLLREHQVLQAKASFRQAIDMPVPSRHRSASIRELGNAYLREGSYSKSKDYFELGLQSAQSRGDLLGVQNSLIQLAYVKINLAQLDAAIRDLLRARSIPTDASTSLRMHNEGRMLDLLAWASDQGGSYAQALRYYEEALLAFQETDQYTQLVKADNYSNRGRVLYRLQRYDESFELLSRAHQLYSGEGVAHGPSLANIHVHLSDVQARRSQIAEALRHSDEALTAWLSQPVPNLSFAALRQSSDLPETIHHLTDRYHLLKRSERAFDADARHLYLLLVDSLIQRVQDRQYFHRSIHHWRSYAHDFYQMAVAEASALHNTTLALYFSEKDKGITILNVLFSDSRTAKYDERDMYVIDSIEHLIQRREKALYLQGGRADLDPDLRLLSDQYYQQIEIFERKYPEFNLSLAGQLTPSIGHQAARRLDAQTSILEYFQGGDSIHYFHLREDTISLHTSLFDSDKRQLLQKLIRWLQDPTSAPSDIEASAHDLSSSLLPEGLTGLRKNVIIIPEANLFSLPFELLHYRQENLMQSRHLRYYFTIRTYLAQAAKRSPPGSGTVLAIAPTYVSPQLKLPHMAKELSSIAAHWQSRRIEDVSSLTAAFEDNLPPTIIHFAAHAKSDPNDNRYSSLRLGDDESDMLYLDDIMDMSWKTELVVLSACETGMGQPVAGEHPQSLGLAFTHAGARSLVQSLWRVDDASTAEIMQGFYRRLADGEPKSQALQNAKLDFMNASPQLWQHPYYWAGIVYYGDDRVISNARKLGWVLPTAGAIALMVVLLYRTHSAKIKGDIPS